MTGTELKLSQSQDFLISHKSDFSIFIREGQVCSFIQTHHPKNYKQES